MKNVAVVLKRTLKQCGVNVTGRLLCESHESVYEKVLYVTNEAANKEPLFIELLSTQTIQASRTRPFERRPIWFLLIEIADLPSLHRALKYTEI